MGAVMFLSAAAWGAETDLEVVRGEHVEMELREADWKLLRDRAAFVGFVDRVYEEMVELTGSEPEMKIRGHENLGAWGTAGLDGIRLDWGVVPGLLRDFEAKKIEFGLVHEMGHIFDAREFPRWYITPSAGGETFANIKLAYVLEELLTEESGLRIEFGPGGLRTGRAFHDGFYGPAGDGYLASTRSWEQMDVDALHSFHHGLIREHGWDVYKKWFRAYLILDEKPDRRAPDGVNDPLRVQVMCALLSGFSGVDLVPYFQKWRLPVTSEEVGKVMKAYRLESVMREVEKQFAAEVRQGKIVLNEKSIVIREEKVEGDGVRFRFVHALAGEPKAEIRYKVSLNGKVSPERRFDGRPVKVAKGALVEAVLKVAGRDAVLGRIATRVGD